MFLYYDCTIFNLVSEEIGELVVPHVCVDKPWNQSRPWERAPSFRRTWTFFTRSRSTIFFLADTVPGRFRWGQTAMPGERTHCDGDVFGGASVFVQCF